MKVEQSFYIGFKDIGRDNKLSVKSLLSFLEDTGGIHSNLVGYGLYDVEKNKLNWVLISWKVKILKNPSYNETVKVITWSKGIERLYSYRDFEVYNSSGELCIIASSKWVLVDREKKSITAPTQELIEAYKIEKDFVIDVKEMKKLQEPANYSSVTENIITRDMIDINNHVHNLNYVDLGFSVLPDNVYYSTFEEVEIMYKKEIKLGEKVKSLYSYLEEEKAHYIAIKSEDESILHAIIKLK